MPKIGKNIYKRKDGRWEGRYFKGRRNNGKIIYGYIYGKSCTEVKKRLEDLKNGEADPSGDEVLNHKDFTFQEVAKQWLTTAFLKVKVSTYTRYEAILKLHVFPVLGERRIRELSTSDISSLANEKLANGRLDGTGGLSAKTVRDILSVIKAVNVYACEGQIVQKGFTVYYPKPVCRELRVLSRHEQEALEKVLLTEMNVYKLGILLCLYTGLRVGEICALQWQDFSADLDCLSVRRSLQRIPDLDVETEEGTNVEPLKINRKTKILVDTPKSKQSVRVIPIPTFLSKHLRQFIQKDSRFLLSSGNRIFTEPRTMQNHFSRNIQEANIKEANFHSLRHTFATRCIEAGVDVKSLSEMLGHTSVNMTLSRYVHSSFEQKKAGIQKLEQYIKD